MTKSGSIVLLSLILTSGCALIDRAEMTSDQQPVPAPVIESVTAPTPAIAETAPVETPIAARRKFTRDDIRLLQSRLRQIGFDPGPVDGVAGTKTSSAAKRLQAGCSNANTVIERWADPNSQVSSASPVAVKIPSRQETQAIQTQLRNAGFNPGPIDGIFGHKTRSLLVQLKNSCPMSSDFAEMLDQGKLATSGSMGASSALESSPGKFPPSNTQVAIDSAKQPTTPQLARSQEEVRILQLQLRDAGFDPGPFDGVMGPKTKSALQQYQASRRGDKATTTLISGFKGHY